jgi:hypothetical protein
MSQLRLIDERTLLCLESDVGYEVLNGDAMDIVGSRLLSMGKGMRNWEKTEETGIAPTSEDKISKKSSKKNSKKAKKEEKVEDEEVSEDDF